MANSSRLMKDKSGKIFMPMNVDGGNWSDSFFSSGKVATMVAMLVFAVFEAMWLGDKDFNWLQCLIIILFTIFMYIELTRYIIFQERYYYKMYIKMKKYKNPTPAVFWDVVSIRDTDDGAVMQYSDLKTAIMVRLERDTIVGRDTDFREQHFDALSDMYKELNTHGLSYIQINLMEPAGKDPRIKKLDELVLRPKNLKIAKLIEKMVGYIKQVTRAALFETDYLLIYTKNPSQADTLINDAVDCLYPVLHGAFVGFNILDSHEILELPKELYGVKYFDYTDATVAMFRRNGVQVGNTFNLEKITFRDGEVKEIGNKENLLVRRLASCINNGSIKYGEWTIKDTLNGRLSIKKSDLAKLDKSNELSIDTDKIEKSIKEREIKKKQEEVRKSDFNVDFDFDDDNDTRDENNNTKGKGSKKNNLSKEADDEFIDF